MIYNTGIITEEYINERLRDCLSFSCEWAIPIIDSFKDFPALQEEALDSEWSIERYKGERGYFLFEKLFTYGYPESAFVLKLAEHNYFNRQYADYNPSRKDLWEDQNRPWDHDHIVPQNWSGDSSEWSPFCNKWINSIGNIADIPFELNRAKQDDAEWSYYYDHSDELLFSPPGGTLELDQRLSEVRESEQRKVFFHFVRDRFLKIVEPFMKILTNLHLSEKLSVNQELRKELLLRAKEKHPECKLYYLLNGIEYEFDINQNYGWQQTWLTLSKDIGHPERVAALTIAIDDDNKFEAECGLRKHPKMYIEQLSNHDWWENGKLIRKKISKDEDNDIFKARGGWNPLDEFDLLLSNPYTWNS